MLINKLKSLFYKKKYGVQSRPDLPLEVIYRGLSSKKVSWEEFISIWELISKVLKVSANKLRLQDRFDHELQELDPFNLDGALWELEDLLRQRDHQVEREIIHTLEEYVVAFLNKL